MISGLKAYPLGRKSDIEWLPDLPAGWSDLRIKQIFRERDERSGDGSGELLSLTRARGLIRHSDATDKMASADDLSKYKVCRPGDLVMNRMQAWSGMFAAAHRDGLVSPDYSVFVPRKRIAVDYFASLFRIPPMMGIFAQRSKGIGTGFNRLYTSDFGAIRIPVPPLDEQEVICRWLSYADERISRFIKSKQELAKLLLEQRRAIVDRAATRGIDGDVRLMPSGIEWLGDMPEHWRAGRIKTELNNLNTRRVPLSSSERGEMTLHEYDYYGASGVIDRVDDYLFDDELLLIAEDGANLVNRNLPLAIVARGRFWVNNHAHILKPKNNGSIEYFAALLESLDYKPWITGAAQPKLTQDRLMAIPIPVPPAAEQEKIAAWIKVNTVDISRAIERARGEVALLREYRSRLIADVVTGQLDVREAAARLPEEPSEIDGTGDALSGPEVYDVDETDGDLELEGASA